MVFQRRKNKSRPADGTPRMRGRNTAADSPGKVSSSDNNPLARRFQADDEPDTIDLSPDAGFHEASDTEQVEATTQIMAGEEPQAEPADDEAPDDPVAGFLVVIEGPGRGAVYTLGFGMNSIGRLSSQRVSLNHSDHGISRENHCVVTFDAAAGKFYLQPGDGRKLTYLENEPVLAPTRLTTGNHIRLGNTVLRFVALCGDDFSWGN